MHVKLCSNCPYTMSDLADVYNPSAKEYCCGTCPQQGLLTTEEVFPRERYYDRPGKGPRFFKENGNAR